VEQVLIGVAAVALLFTVVAVAGVVVAVRGVRRRYRATRRRLVAAYAARPDAHSVLRASGSAAAASVGSPSWWAVQNRRHRMWRAVTSAQHAVAVADRADVAVGDLPALASRLGAAARGVDSVLRATGRHGSLRTEDREDCDRIVAAAADLRAAALASLRSDSHADTSTVVSAVQIEVAALSAGLRAANG
jgi:hypothetical protein